jgi:hypothetical protein
MFNCNFTVPHSRVFIFLSGGALFGPPWAVRKDCLGWIFDGEDKTLELDTDRLDEIQDLLKKAVRNKKGIPFDKFLKLAGKLRHAAFGIP